MEGATFEDLKGNLLKQATIDVVTVRRPLKRHETVKKMEPPGIESSGCRLGVGNHSEHWQLKPDVLGLIHRSFHRALL